MLWRLLWAVPHALLVGLLFGRAFRLRNQGRRKEAFATLERIFDLTSALKYDMDAASALSAAELLLDLTFDLGCGARAYAVFERAQQIAEGELVRVRKVGRRGGTYVEQVARTHRLIGSQLAFCDAPTMRAATLS